MEPADTSMPESVSEKQDGESTFRKHIHGSAGDGDFQAPVDIHGVEAPREMWSMVIQLILPGHSTLRWGFVLSALLSMAVSSAFTQELR